MSKRLHIALTLFAVLCFTGCSSSSSNAPEEQPSETNTDAIGDMPGSNNADTTDNVSASPDAVPNHFGNFTPNTSDAGQGSACAAPNVNASSSNTPDADARDYPGMDNIDLLTEVGFQTNIAFGLAEIDFTVAASGLEFCSHEKFAMNGCAPLSNLEGFPTVSSPFLSGTVLSFDVDYPGQDTTIRHVYSDENGSSSKSIVINRSTSNTRTIEIRRNMDGSESSSSVDSFGTTANYIERSDCSGQISVEFYSEEADEMGTLISTIETAWTSPIGGDPVISSTYCVPGATPECQSETF